MTEATPAPAEPQRRFRWGWIIGCLVIGLSGITAGFLLIAPADRTGYVASVLAGVSTTVLLVGVVVLLERRILDTATTALRQAMDAEREASAARIDQLVADLDDRIATEWARTDADVEALKRRTTELTEETVRRIVDEANATAGQSERGAE